MDLSEAIDRLRRQRLDLDAQRQDLDSKREYIEVQINAVKSKMSNLDSTIATLEALDSAADQDELLAPVDQSVQAGRGVQQGELPAHLLGPQALLRRLLADRPDVVVDSKSAYDMLVDAGWRSQSSDAVNVVRSALSQLHKAGELTKQERGRYVFASHSTGQADDNAEVDNSTKYAAYHTDLATGEFVPVENG